METKTCPYCGEMILAAAKKCKHCGEWIETPATTKPEAAPAPAPEPVPKAVQQKTYNSDPVDTDMLSKLCDWTIGLELLSMIYGLISNFTDRYNGRSVVSSIILGIMWIFVLAGLRRFCRERQLPKTPLITLICLTAAGSLFYLITSFIHLEPNEAVLLSLFILLPLLLAYCVMQFIVGLKFCSNYLTRSLGILFMVHGVLAVLILIIEFCLGNEFLIWTSVVDTVLSIAILYLIKRLVINTEE